MTQICVISVRTAIFDTVPSDTQLIFADHVGRFYARQYGFPPMAGRLLGYLFVCDPPQQTIDELGEALLASRSAITGAVKLLEGYRMARRTRVAGERVDRVSLDPASQQPQNFDSALHRSMRRCSGRDWRYWPTLHPNAAPHSRKWSRWPTSSASDSPPCWTSGTRIATRSGIGTRGNSSEKRKYIMTESDLSVLRERAENGDATAVDILIELAGERGDMDELRRLADNGSSDAADQLIEVATELGDMNELRRLADNGNITAAEQLMELTEE